MKNFQIPPSVLNPTSAPSCSFTFSVCERTPSLFLILYFLSSSPNFPTIPSSEHFAIKTEERLSISAIVVVPYSEVNAFQAEPELSERAIVFPFNFGIFSIEISIHSSSVSNTFAL